MILLPKEGKLYPYQIHFVEKEPLVECYTHLLNDDVLRVDRNTSLCLVQEAIEVSSHIMRRKISLRELIKGDIRNLTFMEDVITHLTKRNMNMVLCRFYPDFHYFYNEVLPHTEWVELSHWSKASCPETEKKFHETAIENEKILTLAEKALTKN